MVGGLEHEFYDFPFTIKLTYNNIPDGQLDDRKK